MGESVYVDMSKSKDKEEFLTPNYHDDIGFDTIAEFSGEIGKAEEIKKLKQAEVFTGATTKQKLKQVSVHSTDPDTGWTIKIYANLKSKTNPESGTLVFQTVGTFKYAGYYTVPISKEVTLDAGANYSVVYESKNKNKDNVYSFSLEYKNNDKDYLRYNTNESFISFGFSKSDTKYTDIRTALKGFPEIWPDVNKVGNLDIKAYTKPVAAKKSTNNYLSKLKTSKGKLSPAFKKSRTSYKITLSKKQSWTKISATKSNKYAKVQIKLTGQKKYKNISSAKISLKKGKSKYCYVKVTSQSGKTKGYKIKISRKKR
jgi:hypothetical protein